MLPVETNEFAYQPFEDFIDKEAAKTAVITILDNLHDERLKEILILRYGLFGCNNHTLSELGEKFGVSREKIRQLIAKAQRKALKIKNLPAVQSALIAVCS
jgi:RNA polymerase sigma factor (sigma-70 family)